MILLWQWWEEPVVIPGGAIRGRRSDNREPAPALPWEGETEDFEVVAVLAKWLECER